MEAKRIKEELNDSAAAALSSSIIHYQTLPSKPTQTVPDDLRTSLRHQWQNLRKPVRLRERTVRVCALMRKHRFVYLYAAAASGGVT